MRPQCYVWENTRFELGAKIQLLWDGVVPQARTRLPWAGLSDPNTRLVCALGPVFAFCMHNNCTPRASPVRVGCAVGEAGFALILHLLVVH